MKSEKEIRNELSLIRSNYKKLRDSNLENEKLLGWIEALSWVLEEDNRCVKCGRELTWDYIIEFGNLCSNCKKAFSGVLEE